VIAKRKGVTMRWGLKEAWSKRGPMNKNRMKRPTVPGERASDREAHIHQGCWW
jgi:hypothetical protein